MPNHQFICSVHMTGITWLDSLRWLEYPRAILRHSAYINRWIITARNSLLITKPSIILAIAQMNDKRWTRQPYQMSETRDRGLDGQPEYFGFMSVSSFPCMICVKLYYYDAIKIGHLTSAVKLLFLRRQLENWSICDLWIGDSKSGIEDFDTWIQKFQVLNSMVDIIFQFWHRNFCWTTWNECLQRVY